MHEHRVLRVAGLQRVLFLVLVGCGETGAGGRKALAVLPVGISASTFPVQVWPLHNGMPPSPFPDGSLVRKLSGRMKEG